MDTSHRNNKDKKNNNHYEGKNHHKQIIKMKIDQSKSCTWEKDMQQRWDHILKAKRKTVKVDMNHHHVENPQKSMENFN